VVELVEVAKLAGAERARRVASRRLDQLPVAASTESGARRDLVSLDGYVDPNWDRLAAKSLQSELNRRPSRT
jgi:hypothetical protein